MDHNALGNHAAVAPVPTEVLVRDAPARTSSHDSISNDEKIDEKIDTPTDEKHPHVENVIVSDLPEIYDVLSGDPIPPMADLPEEGNQLTVRAIVIGCILGGIIQASNIYLGLKTGFTFAASLFGAIFGFAIIKPLSKILPPYLGGGYFGPKENTTVQTAATAAGGLGIIYVSGIPAMYQLGLLGAEPKDDIGRLFALAAVGAFYGMSFAIPMRKWYILKQKLVFPTPMATAFTIHAMHAGPAGAADAAKKSWCLFWSFLGATILRVVSNYVPGILYNFNPAWYIYTWGWHGVIGASNWGWYIQFTPAFFGAGILAGVNASYSFFFGAILAWGIIGPSLIATGRAAGRVASETYPEIISYYSMAPADPRSNEVSPRYWLLWPGVLIMLGASFAEVGVNWRSLYNGMKILYKSADNEYRLRTHKPPRYEIESEDIDKTAKEDRVPWWLWSGTLVASIIVTCVVMARLFQVNVGYTILAIILGFLFSVIGVQSAGATDVNPISTVAKASQIVFGGVTRGKYPDQDVISPTTGIRSNPGAERVNLIAGLLSGMAAAQTVDMTGDLKTGHLLGARPKVQFIAQACGAVVSIFLSTGLYILFVSAYPCINEISPDTCSFGAPSVGAWRAVAVAVTGDGLPLPTSSGVVGLVLMFVAIGCVIARETIVPKKYRVFVPNWNSIGLAFVLNSTVYNSAMFWGSTFGFFWKRRNPKSFDLFAYALAAGLIAGEGIAGVITALLTIVNRDGSVYGTPVGCAGLEFCG